MRYIIFLLSLFLAPLYVLLTTVLFQKILEPKMNKENNEVVLMAIPNNIFTISIGFDVIVFLYTFKILNLSQLAIALMIATCLLIMYTSINSGRVVFLNQKGFFTRKKSYDKETDNISVVVSIEYNLDEDNKGVLNENGLLQISLINEKNELYTNHFIFGEDKAVFKHIKNINSYKNIKYKTNDKVFKTFDEVFTYIINNISNKKLVDKYRENILSLYKNANPNGDFEKLQISVNYK